MSDGKKLYKTDFSGSDGLYYMVSEENNKKFLQSLIPDRKGEKTDLKGFFNRELEIVGKEEGGCRSNSHKRYFRQLPNGFSPCPQVLMYQIQDDFDMNISHFCCHEFKKKPIKDYMKQSKRSITLTGMMRTEGGQRTTLNCIVTDKDGALKKFHPMAVCTTEWEDWYIKARGIKLSELYYPPFNFTRTGCIGCPFAKDIKSELETLSLLEPSEYKRAQWLWKTVYDEYRRIGYRLDNQPTLFD